MMPFCLNNSKWVANNPSKGIFNVLPEQTPSVEKKKHSVKFAEICRVVLVPKREEYHAAGIKLWWSQSEFNQFKRERYLELTEEESKSPSVAGEAESIVPLPSKDLTPCYILNLNVLVCTPQSPMKCQVLSNFSKYLWGDENPDRQGTSVCVTYSTHEKALSNIDGNNPNLPSLGEFNIIILDHATRNSCVTAPPLPSVSAPLNLSGQKQLPLSSPVKVTCDLVRKLSHQVVLICIMEDEATIQSNDDSSADQADLLLPFPDIPSCDHWKQLLNLLILRKQTDDFFPSPLLQQYITALK